MAELADAHGSARVTSVKSFTYNLIFGNILICFYFCAIKYVNQELYADVAELADAHGSGPCESNFMQVQVLLSAPYREFL